MNLYIVERTDTTSSGDLVSILCTAETNYKAKKLKNRWSRGYGGYVKLKWLKAKKIGISAIYTKPKILMESWNSE